MVAMERAAFHQRTELITGYIDVQLLRVLDIGIDFVGADAGGKTLKDEILAELYDGLERILNQRRCEL